MAAFFSTVFGFIGTCVNYIGTGVLHIIIVVVAAVIAGAGGALLCSCINDLTLRGKPDYDQTGTPATMVGFVLGVVIGAVICLWLLCTSTLSATVNGMLGVYGIIIALIVLTWFINRKHNQGRAAKEAPAKRFRPF